MTMTDPTDTEPDLNELMNRDPLGLSDTDIDAIVAGMRERRHRFNLGDQKAGSAKPRATPKALKGLDDEVLDLEIKL